MKLQLPGYDLSIEADPMELVQAVHSQFTFAIDLLNRRRKALRFICHCSASHYRHEAETELAVIEERIAHLRQKLEVASV